MGHPGKLGSNMRDSITTDRQHYNMSALWLACLVAAMGGLLFGYDWVVIGGAKPFYEPFFGISNSTELQGLAMSSALFGCLAGAMATGALSDRMGRKRLLIIAGLLFTLSAVWTALAGGFTTFIMARILGGVGIGLASNLSPMYIAELSPAPIRGRFVSINQLTIVIGILAAQITNMVIAQPVPTANQIRLLLNESSAAKAMANDPEFDMAKATSDAARLADQPALKTVLQRFPGIQYIAPITGDDRQAADQRDAKTKQDDAIMVAYIAQTPNGQVGWRWMFGAETVPAAAFFLLMFFIPESPRWLMKYGRDEQAMRVLAMVGGDDYARAEVADIKSTLSNTEVAQVHFSDLLSPKLLRIIGLGVFLAVFQQWCGINVIFNYAQEVFSAAGYGVSGILFNIVITGIVSLLFTFVAIYTVDSFGRRPLMLIGAGGLAVIYAVLGTGYYFKSTGIYMLILVISAIACYAMTLAPMVWVIISELFPNRIRGAAMSVAVFSLWVGCLLLTYTFPWLNETLGAHGAFWLYGAICAAGFVVIYLRLPETKGKSLETIERELMG